MQPLFGYFRELNVGSTTRMRHLAGVLLTMDVKIGVGRTYPTIGYNSMKAGLQRRSRGGAFGYGGGAGLPERSTAPRVPAQPDENATASGWLTLGRPREPLGE